MGSGFTNESGKEGGEQPVAASTGAPVDSNVHSFPKMASPITVPPEASPQDAMPIWMRRISLVIFVVFCLEVGLLLTVLPWTRVWTDNALMLDYPWLRPIIEHGFVRGMVTGVGLVDIYLGISEAVLYRENRRS